MVNVEKGTRRKVCICFQHDFLLAVCPNLQLSLGGGFPRGYSRNFYYFLATNVFYLFLVLAFEVLQLSEENILSTKVTRLHAWLRAIQSSCKSVCKLLTFYFYFYFFMAIIENRCWSRHSERSMQKEISQHCFLFITGLPIIFAIHTECIPKWVTITSR